MIVDQRTLIRVCRKVRSVIQYQSKLTYKVSGKLNRFSKLTRPLLQDVGISRVQTGTVACMESTRL